MTAKPWGARSIFLSSTFRDMHSERDHLRRYVSPQLAEALRMLRRHFEPVDLRTGVEMLDLDSESDREVQVLRVCIDEIERSRPSLIVLLGDRYGWGPPASSIEAVARQAGVEP